MIDENFSLENYVKNQESNYYDKVIFLKFQNKIKINNILVEFRINFILSKNKNIYLFTFRRLLFIILINKLQI